MAGNRQTPPPAPAAASKEQEHRPSMAAPTQRHEETKTFAPEPAPGKPEGETAVNSMVPSEEQKEAPTSGLLAKAAHKVGEVLGFQEPEAPRTDVDLGHKTMNKEEIAAATPAKGIEVKAVGPGFIYRSRKNPGDIFKIKDESMLGEWMMPTDPELAKKHVANIKAKREAGREAQAKRREARRTMLGL